MVTYNLQIFCSSTLEIFSLYCRNMTCFQESIEFANVLVIWTWFACMAVFGYMFNKYKNKGFQFEFSFKVCLLEGTEYLERNTPNYFMRKNRLLISFSVHWIYYGDIFHAELNIWKDISGTIFLSSLYRRCTYGVCCTLRTYVRTILVQTLTFLAHFVLRI